MACRFLLNNKFKKMLIELKIFRNCNDYLIKDKTMSVRSETM